MNRFGNRINREQVWPAEKSSCKGGPGSNWGLFWETCVEVDPSGIVGPRESRTKYGEPEGAVGGKPAGPTKESGEPAGASCGKPEGPTKRSLDLGRQRRK